MSKRKARVGVSGSTRSAVEVLLAENVESLLRLTRRWDVRKRRLGTFSGGMRQRFGIAQALLGNPELIIVDEPTNGLDPEERRRFLNLLAEIGEQAVVILSTHLVADVRELCGAMAVINKGRVLIQGTPERLVDQLKGRVWQKAPEDGELDTDVFTGSIANTNMGTTATGNCLHQLREMQ